METPLKVLWKYFTNLVILKVCLKMALENIFSIKMFLKKMKLLTNLQSIFKKLKIYFFVFSKEVFDKWFFKKYL